MTSTNNVTEITEATVRGRRARKAAPAKVTKAPAKKAAPAKAIKSSGATPKDHPGFEIKWTRPGGVFAKNVSAAEGQPAWLVICIHGTAKAAERTGSGENGTRTVLAARASWCKACKAEETAAAKAAPVKAPAKAAAKAVPARKAAARTTTKRAAK